MSNQHHIQDELRDMNSELPHSGAPNPLSVPEGYFDGLASSILDRIKGGTAANPSEAAAETAALSPLLASLSRQMPYSLPEGYFGQTVSDLPLLVREEESSPVLQAIGREMPYAVPQGYFDDLAETVLRKAAPAKVIPMVKRRWMRLAVAAAVTGIVALSGYFYLSGKDQVADPSSQVAQQLKNVSTKELEEFIKTTDITAVSNQTASVKSNPDAEVKELLNGVSDTELDAFLNQVPGEDEDLLVIN